ncbi:FGGY-family carbohydrate kinase [Kibdelosporangium phytohabitans]|uniref:Sugar kinase n=1 Tax=Kibdelosporangium phytohabitans TaxID=860235 RepID=A0A0N9IB90_9PSEU|nr:FGGY-family carbohydrate kinase [Kibdelosporangium phytohabitans]ALG12408.1 sugar kinase [Kibdelosporangium phytohabitans]MBE1463991.1 xylulokinase [Kibdelosporangium phytohabitans]
MLIGIDIGTSSSKGVLVRPDGTIVARASRPHTVSSPRPGWAEHDAEAVWWADFVAIAGELVAAAPSPITGLGVSGIGPCLLPASADGRPLRPAILYGVDTRATAEIEDMTASLGAEAILRRGGTPLSSQAVGPKVMWLARNEPDVFARTSLLLMASSYLVLRLTGRYVLDHHSASQCDPMYDMHTADWARDWCADLAPDLTLPELFWPGDVVGTITAAAAEQTGLPEGLPVTAGTIDAWAEATSVGVRSPGDVMVMYGTTMFVIKVEPEPRPHPALWTTQGAFEGTYSLAAGMATSGAITDWLRQLFAGSFSDLVTRAAAVPAGSRGLLMLPYFAGERTPIFDPAARGVLAGLTLSHGQAEIYRAALEGTAYGLRHNLEVMGGAQQRVVAVGGGTQGDLWAQIVSDVTGVPQQLPAETVGACFGSAMFAASAMGHPVADWNPLARTVTPDPARTAKYDLFYEHYRALYPATRDLAHFLAADQLGN